MKEGLQGTNLYSEQHVCR